MELWHLLLTAIFSLLCQEYSRKDGIKRILQSCFFLAFSFSLGGEGEGVEQRAGLLGLAREVV